MLNINISYKKRRCSMAGKVYTVEFDEKIVSTSSKSTKVEAKACPKCGAKVTGKFCEYCGEKIAE